MATAEAASVTEGLIAPHGGKLINLQLPQSEWEAAIKSCNRTFEASDRNACDVELLSVGYVLLYSIDYINILRFSAARYRSESLQPAQCLLAQNSEASAGQDVHNFPYP